MPKQKPLPRTATQKELAKLLKADGWTETRGGKHVVKMEKPGRRPVTIPKKNGATLGVSLTAAILRESGINEGASNG